MKDIVLAVIALALLLFLLEAHAQLKEPPFVGPTGPCGEGQWEYVDTDATDFTTIKGDQKGNVRVILETRVEVNRICAAMAERPFDPTLPVNGCSLVFENPERTPIVVVERPRGFNDRARLCVLGHEMMHVLGASHGLRVWK